MTANFQDRHSERAPKSYAYCARCGYMFIKTPPDPPVPCRCGRMEEAA